jgi:ring-1,2-phenylacetyl-CoA epoxidase subunit PaaC
MPAFSYLADNSLILGHRNSEWTGHGPVLEQDIALSNIALDLIGQARHLYQHAANLINASKELHAAEEMTEDKLAYLRDSWDYKNCLLVEQSNGDWGKTIMRQFLFSAWHQLAYGQLQNSKDPELAAIAEKSLKETHYHLRWSSEWVIRLGDGTEESHRRMLIAVSELWKYTGELFVPSIYELEMKKEGIGYDLSNMYKHWTERVCEVFAEAKIALPKSDGQPLTGGKEGRHTEQMGYILAEMQFLQRAYPGCEW